MNFSDLNLTTPLHNALNDMEFTNPTPIQEQTFSAIMSGKDIVGIAQTGTGKTLAYLLPLLRMHKFSTDRHPSILIIVPTRELVIQILAEIKKLTAYMNVRYAGVYGGTNINTQKQTVYDGLDILVATVGRLYDLSLSGILRIKSVKKLVIDEVDEMLNLGFKMQITAFLELLSEKRQNLMFSATLSPEVEILINNFFENPEKVIIEKHGTPLELINQTAYKVPNYNTKVNLLSYLLENDKSITKALVFVSTKKLADKLFEALTGINQIDETEDSKTKISAIHSNKSQNLRLKTVSRFNEGEIRVLIATDIIARGVDIEDVTHVFNFDIPELPGNYMHRIGRTGRAGKTGIAVSFVTNPEYEFFKAIELMMKLQISLIPIPEEVVISEHYTKEEKPDLFDKNYLKIKPAKKQTGGSAFHEKKEKNKKQNSGSPSKKRAKYTKSGNKIK